MARLHAHAGHLGAGETARPHVRRRWITARHAATGRAGSRYRLHREAGYQVRSHHSRSREHSLSPGKGRLAGPQWKAGSGVDRYPARRAGRAHRRGQAAGIRSQRNAAVIRCIGTRGESPGDHHGVESRATPANLHRQRSAAGPRRGGISKALCPNRATLGRHMV